LKTTWGEADIKRQEVQMGSFVLILAQLSPNEQFAEVSPTLLRAPKLGDRAEDVVLGAAEIKSLPFTTVSLFFVVPDASMLMPRLLAPPGGWSLAHQETRGACDGSMHLQSGHPARAVTTGFGGNEVAGERTLMGPSASYLCWLERASGEAVSSGLPSLPAGGGWVVRALAEAHALVATGAYARIGPMPGGPSGTLPFDASTRAGGLDWPHRPATSMVGIVRLGSLESMLESVALRGVVGDFVELGVWRGGASLFASRVMSALCALGHPTACEGRVWLLDSYEGLPSSTLSQDVFFTYDHVKEVLTGTLPEVISTFEHMGGLRSVSRGGSHRVCGPSSGLGVSLVDRGSAVFVQGFFNDSLSWMGSAEFPADCPGHRSLESISVLRLDGDMYESTMDALFRLAPKVQVGGIVVMDDWNLVTEQAAVEHFRRRVGWKSPIIHVDDTDTIQAASSCAYFFVDKRAVIDEAMLWWRETGYPAADEWEALTIGA